MFSDKYGPIIKAIRIRAGMSQDDLAQKMHCSRSAISKLENDQKVLDVTTLIHLAEVTGAKEVVVAFIVGMDGISILQNILGMVIG